MTIFTILFQLALHSPSSHAVDFTHKLLCRGPLKSTLIEGFSYIQDGQHEVKPFVVMTAKAAFTTSMDPGTFGNKLKSGECQFVTNPPHPMPTTGFITMMMNFEILQRLQKSPQSTAQGFNRETDLSTGVTRLPYGVFAGLDTANALFFVDTMNGTTEQNFELRVDLPTNPPNYGSPILRFGN